MGFGMGPPIVRSDKTVPLEADNPEADAMRAALAPFAELERAPEHVHIYRITPLALWSTRTAGHDTEKVVDVLEHFSRSPVSQSLLIDVAETMDRYDHLSLAKHPVHGLILISHNPAVLTEMTKHKKIRPVFGGQVNADTQTVHPSERGQVKQELLKVDWPASDTTGYIDGETCAITWQNQGTGGHDTWELCGYQCIATDSFREDGSGVVMLPCGAGEIIIDTATMVDAQHTTLILVTSAVAGGQWRDELPRRTSLTEDEIDKYPGEEKKIRPVTIVTY